MAANEDSFIQNCPIYALLLSHSMQCNKYHRSRPKPSNSSSLFF